MRRAHQSSSPFLARIECLLVFEMAFSLLPLVSRARFLAKLVSPLSPVTSRLAAKTRHTPRLSIIAVAGQHLLLIRFISLRVEIRD